MKSISVAMATYNGGNFLERQLISLVEQQRKPDEIIIFDDRSSDNTLDVISRFISNSNLKIKLEVNPENVGYRENFMRAANACGGDYIAFCDQDDVWRSDKISKILSELDQSDALLCYHDAEVIDSAGAVIGNLSRYRHNDSTVRKCQDFWFNPHGMTQVFRRELLDYSNLWPLSFDHRVERGEPLAHDQWMFFLADTLGKVKYIPDKLVHYRQHGDNVVGFDRAGPLTYRLAAARNTGSQQYGRIAKDALSRAAILDRLSEQVPQVRVPTVRAAAKLYRELADLYVARSTLFSSNKSSSKVALLVKLVAQGAYHGNARPNFGARALLKDAVFSNIARG
jgi:glycosyltransferase involved in cell wall biosynthesis